MLMGLQAGCRLGTIDQKRAESEEYQIIEEECIAYDCIYYVHAERIGDPFLPETKEIEKKLNIDQREHFIV